MSFKNIAVATLVSACAVSSFAAGSSFLSNADSQLNISGDSSQTFTFYVAPAGLTLGADPFNNSVFTGKWDLTSVVLDDTISFSQQSDINANHYAEVWALDSGQLLAAGAHHITVTVAPGWTPNFTYSGSLIATAGKFSTASPVTITSVPEPESYAMFLAGLGALGFIGRRRMNAHGR
jgi:hypothetical protein